MGVAAVQHCIGQKCAMLYCTKQQRHKVNAVLSQQRILLELRAFEHAGRWMDGALSMKLRGCAPFELYTRVLEHTDLSREVR